LDAFVKLSKNPIVGGVAAWTTSRRPGAKIIKDMSFSKASSLGKTRLKTGFLMAVGARLRCAQTVIIMYESTSAAVAVEAMLAGLDDFQTPQTTGSKSRASTYDGSVTIATRASEW
jgi:hypothetical protein